MYHSILNLLYIIRCFFVKSCFGKPVDDGLLYRPYEYELYDSSKCINFSRVFAEWIEWRVWRFLPAVCQINIAYIFPE